MSLSGMSLVNPQLRCISFRHMDGGDFFDWRCTISDINSPKTWCKKHKRSDGIWLLFFIFCNHFLGLFSHSIGVLFSGFLLRNSWRHEFKIA